MTDLFNIVATICIVEMSIVLALIENDRASKSESLSIVWSRRAGFGSGAATLLYAGLSQNWQTAFLLAAGACAVIFAVNIISIKARNHPPLHGHRFISRAIAKATFRRYP